MKLVHLAPLCLALGACSAPIVQNEELSWFESGWYVGATGGTAIADASASDLDRRLSNQGFTTNSEIEDDDSAWKGFVGYRFEERFGFEVGYTNLGEISSEVDTMNVDPNVLLDALADTQPFLGRGPTISGIWYALDTKRIDGGLRAGVWYWEADLEAETNSGQNVSFEDDGFDAFYGIFGLFEFNERAHLRFEWERYILDDDDADFLSVGLQIRVN